MLCTTARGSAIVIWQLPPLPEQRSHRTPPVEIWLLEVAGEKKMQRETHRKQCSLAGTVVTIWDSTREIGELGDTRRWEKRGLVTDHDPRTGQRVGLCEKPYTS